MNLTSLAAFTALGGVALAQDLAPRAYLITPKGSNALTTSFSYSSGTVFVDPSVPIEDTGVRFSTQAISYYRSLNVWGRSSNLTLLVPYAVGTVDATLLGTPMSVYRSGFADARVRFAVNLFGGPAMSPKDFVSWREKGLLGASVTVLIPSGQYDPARLINNGNNRWSFKPEIGLSRRWNRWVWEGYLGSWFFSPNNFYYPGGSRRTQEPFLASEMHLTYYVTRRLWISADGNFWRGGRSSINGFEKEDEQRNSRAGITAALPLNQRQALKFSYSRGAYVTLGGDYRTWSAAWQYSWLDKIE
jgi:hypothetical protein